MAAALPLSRPSAAPRPASRQWPRFALVLAAIVAAISLLPYLLTYLWTPPGHHFAGFFFIADDATTYLAKMRQGADGAWLWNDPYTSEPHAGVFLFSFYLLFGHLAALLHLPLIATYHLARISGAIALVLAADQLCRRLLPREVRRLALVLVVLASGAGFLAQALGNPSVFGSPVEALDLHLPEISGWYSILATIPLLAYNAWTLFGDPTIAEWAHQWRHQAPGPVSLVVSLGLPLLAATVGLVVAWRRRDRGLALLFVWPPLVLALLYLPNIANIQRRLLDALYVPVGILAALGIRTLRSRLRRARARRIEAILVTSCCLSSLIVLAIALRFASGAFAEAYVGDDSWRAMQWLSSHHQPGDRALSSPGAGQLLPAWAGVPVYVGHYSETLDYFQKIRNVGTVLGPDAPDRALQTFLAANRLTLLYWGPDEAATGFHPAE